MSNKPGMKGFQPFKTKPQRTYFIKNPNKTDKRDIKPKKTSQNKICLSQAKEIGCYLLPKRERTTDSTTSSNKKLKSQHSSSTPKISTAASSEKPAITATSKSKTSIKNNPVKTTTPKKAPTSKTPASKTPPTTKKRNSKKRPRTTSPMQRFSKRVVSNQLTLKDVSVVGQKVFMKSGLKWYPATIERVAEAGVHVQYDSTEKTFVKGREVGTMLSFRNNKKHLVQLQRTLNRREQKELDNRLKTKQIHQASPTSNCVVGKAKLLETKKIEVEGTTWFIRDPVDLEVLLASGGAAIVVNLLEAVASGGNKIIFEDDTKLTPALRRLVLEAREKHTAVSGARCAPVSEIDDEGVQLKTIEKNAYTKSLEKTCKHDETPFPEWYAGTYDKKGDVKKLLLEILEKKKRMRTSRAQKVYAMVKSLDNFVKATYPKFWNHVMDKRYGIPAKYRLYKDCCFTQMAKTGGSFNGWCHNHIDRYSIINAIYQCKLSFL